MGDRQIDGDRHTIFDGYDVMDMMIGIVQLLIHDSIYDGMI